MIAAYVARIRVLKAQTARPWIDSALEPIRGWSELSAKAKGVRMQSLQTMQTKLLLRRLKHSSSPSASYGDFERWSMCVHPEVNRALAERLANDRRVLRALARAEDRGGDPEEEEAAANERRRPRHPWRNPRRDAEHNRGDGIVSLDLECLERLSHRAPPPLDNEPPMP